MKDKKPEIVTSSFRIWRVSACNLLLKLQSNSLVPYNYDDGNDQNEWNALWIIFACINEFHILFLRKCLSMKQRRLHSADQLTCQKSHIHHFNNVYGNKQTIKLRSIFWFCCCIWFIVPLIAAYFLKLNFILKTYQLQIGTEYIECFCNWNKIWVVQKY